MKFDRRDFLAGVAASTALPGRAFATTSQGLRPEDFGARGDGATNDTKAFAALSAEVNRRGGGTIVLRSGRTYVVGAQQAGGQLGWDPQPVLELHHLAQPLRIIGNGARLRCQPGLRFGTFDRGTGEAVQRPMPNSNRSELASPYRGLIHVHDCTGSVDVRDVELDGNIERLRIGGTFGDKGWQVPATGLFLVGNSGPETVDNVYSHHHGQDGAMFIGARQREARSRINRLIARYNCRQGLSITGGHGYDFDACEFSHTGRSIIHSAPSAGVDIEAEGRKIIRDLTFTRCSFVDNVGCGLLAESGDSEGARFTECRFVGTTSWSAWPRKPDFSFVDCTFVGSVVNAYPDTDPARAAHFLRCRFTDDPKLSPTGQVFVGGGPLVNLGKSDNVEFDECVFDAAGAGVLPWSWKAVYRDCTMRQRSPKPAETKGRFLGQTTISGPVHLYGSMIEGSLIVNGHRQPRGAVGAIAPW
jgi:hypothetical protein